MGLDMYLEGRKYLTSDWDDPQQDVTEDGFRLKEKTLELGYWRKHPNLHGYIVNNFADGAYNCQPIVLNEPDIKDIIHAIKYDSLPHTTGFFFGTSTALDSPSYEEEKQEDIEIFNKALKWLEVDEPKTHKSVIYQASW